jgi:DNA mismatch repair protein MutL
MTDVIKLLPDHVINQIAAGEVIQRPASAVKELLENAIDAGATKIKLIIKDAGKTLIQVVDNGKGMSDTDARLCFEKHATSKISTAEDIFKIRTNGFRGEALASIAAISTVELKTKQAENEAGCRIEIQNSKVILQEHCPCATGSSFSVRNLFFNTPARKNFLKSDTSEFRHILEEFHRNAISHPEIDYIFFNQDKELFHLLPGNLKQRLMSVFGNGYGEKIAPVSEKTDIISIEGFIGKPEFAKKTRGEQFFFVNHRYIKNPYLHHALQSAYIELVSRDCYPSYFIFIEIEPDKLDVNIHPTKTEIKFEDESAIYAILKATIKRSLGQHNFIPPMDFEQEQAIPFPSFTGNMPIRPPQIKLDPNYNPFLQEKRVAQTHEIYRGGEAVVETFFPETEKSGVQWLKQWNERYILALKNAQLMIIDQHHSWQRIFYEEALESLQNGKSMLSQKEMFPLTVQMPAEDFNIVMEIKDDLRRLGFDISEFGKQTLIIYGIPSGISSSSAQKMLEEIIEECKQNQGNEMKEGKAPFILQQIAAGYAGRMAGMSAKVLNEEEMDNLMERLMNCKIPTLSPKGKRTYLEISAEQVPALFKNLMI